MREHRKAATGDSVCSRGKGESQEYQHRQKEKYPWPALARTVDFAYEIYRKASEKAGYIGNGRCESKKETAREG